MSLFSPLTAQLGFDPASQELPIDGEVGSLFGSSGSDALFGSSDAGSNANAAYGGTDPSTCSGASQLASVLPGLYDAISKAISQFFATLGGGETGATSGFGATPFANFSASSTGDPHDAMTGTTANGNPVDAHWDDMRSAPHLLSSPSFEGGFNIAGTTGTPNANGATYNQSVRVSADHGRDQIVFNGDGTSQITRDGVRVAPQPGQSVRLGGGLSVTETGSGLDVIARNSSGGSISTQLSANANGGVDVAASGRNVALAGRLVDGAFTGASRGFAAA